MVMVVWSVVLPFMSVAVVVVTEWHLASSWRIEWKKLFEVTGDMM